MSGDATHAQFAEDEAVAVVSARQAEDVSYLGDVIAVGDRRGFVAIDRGLAETDRERDTEVLFADARRVPAEHHVLLVFDKAVYVARVDDGYLVSWSVGGAEATETFRTPLAAVERAIALQKELS